jgi:hypothetical protein
VTSTSARSGCRAGSWARTSPAWRGYSRRVISAAWVALAVLAIDAPPAVPLPNPCAQTSFAGSEAFLVVGRAVARDSVAIASVQRARARRLEATAIRGMLFEKMGASYWVVYGAFASQEGAAAKAAELAKMKVAASVMASGPPIPRAPDWRAPIVRICGDARREGSGGTRLSRVPIAIDLRDVHYVTETDPSGYFEIWLKGWGQAYVGIVPCGHSESTPATDAAQVDLPKVPGASVRTPPLRQNTTGCGE